MSLKARLKFDRASRGIAMGAGVFAALVWCLQAACFGANPNDLWISLRPDGRNGTGARSDPFDGGNQPRLDALLKAVPPNATIHFAAGTFLTTGIQAKEGWRIAGAGKDSTIIKLIDGALLDITPGCECCVISHFDFQGFFKYFALKDLTIDCNRSNQPAFKKNLKGYSLDAWIIAAKNAKIENVRAMGTWANPGEGFPCHIYHDGSKSGGDRIEISGCENLNPVGYLTAISAFDQLGGTFSGFIRNCLVTDHPRGSAFGSGGWRNFDVSHNVTRNVAIPLVIDTHNYYDVRIFENRFYNCGAWGVLFNGAGVYENISIHHNIFEMADTATGPCLNPGRSKGTITVYRNTFIQKNVAAPVLVKGPNMKASVRENTVRRRMKGG